MQTIASPTRIAEIGKPRVSASWDASATSYIAKVHAVSVYEMSLIKWSTEVVHVLALATYSPVNDLHLELYTMK